jgi:hypothetical protein
MIVTCIDNSNKPADFPESKWLEKDKDYTVINAFEDMNSTLTFVLKEIDTSNLFPYKGFNSNRFFQKNAIHTLKIAEEMAI